MWAVPILVLGFVLPVQADQVINDDLIVTGSECVGFDCVNGESFGFDTIRLKENNLRINFNDTSAGSFPTRNWQLRANASGSGGASFFGIVDQENDGTSETGTVVFQVEAGARANALFVEADGDIGIGTSNPVVDVHIVTGDTPTLRLDQDSSGGFTPQVWDVGGNETNFFVRDVTSGSRLPLRIRPNAPTSSIDIEGTTGDIGIGTSAPDAPIHVRRTNALARILVEDAQLSGGIKNLLSLRNVNGGVQLRLEKDNADDTWIIRNNDTLVFLNSANAGATTAQMTLSSTGNLAVVGTISSGGTTLNVPDFVFESDYKLTPLSELADFIAEKKHLPNIPSADEVKAAGQLNLSEFQMKLLQKIEELTLYTIDQQKTIDQQQGTIEDLKTRLEKVENAAN